MLRSYDLWLNRLLIENIKTRQFFNLMLMLIRLNEYCAQISTDPDYDKDSVMLQLNDILCNQNNDFSDWSASSVCALLSKMKHTATLR